MTSVTARFMASLVNDTDSRVLCPQWKKKDCEPLGLAVPIGITVNFSFLFTDTPRDASMKSRAVRARRSAYASHAINPSA